MRCRAWLAALVGAVAAATPLWGQSTTGRAHSFLVTDQNPAAARPAANEPTPIVSSVVRPANSGAIGSALRWQDDDVPPPPETGDRFRPVGPPMQVQSTAATMPDEFYRPQDWCQLGPPFRLFNQTPSGLNIGGWQQVGYHHRETQMFLTRQRKLNLHQFWMFVDRPALRTCDWTAGYRVDLMYGLDAQKIQARGNNPAGNPRGWDNSLDHGQFGWAIPQAYGEVARDNVAIRGGYFLSPVGYEGLAAVDNFFYSRTYTRFFSQPFTHTGVIGSYTTNSGATLFGGVTLGWDSAFDRTEDGLNFLGGVRTQVNRDLLVSYWISAGDTGYRGQGYFQSLVVDMTLTDQLNYIVQTDSLDIGDEIAFSLIHNLIYHVNPCLAFGTRLEWWKSNVITGQNNSTWSWTNGLNFRPHANVVVRPETRLDWGAGALRPGDAIFAIDAIVTF